MTIAEQVARRFDGFSIGSKAARATRCICDEVTWLPDREERARLHAAARQALQPAT